jgi:DNA-binding NarL/FixJ family response regulator
MPELTPRQRQIMNAVLEGASNRAIAERLGLCEQTIKNQLTRIYRTVGVTGRVELAMAAVVERTNESPPEGPSDEARFGAG